MEPANLVTALWIASQHVSIMMYTECYCTILNKHLITLFSYMIQYLVKPGLLRVEEQLGESKCFIYSYSFSYLNIGKTSLEGVIHA